MTYGEDKKWIIQECARAGCRITERQLAEWHRIGLIPKPKKMGLGRGQGSASVYPENTIRQVIECADLLKNYSVDTAGWILWLKNFSVDDRFWREPFQRNVLMFLRVRAWATDKSDSAAAFPELTDEADAKLLNICLVPNLSGWLSFARRVLNKKLADLVVSALSVAIGAFERCYTSQNDDQLGSSIGRLIGTQAAPKKARHVQPLILEFDGGSVADNMAQMSAAFRNPSLQLETKITKNEIEKIRNELLFMLCVFDGIQQSDPEYLGRARLFLAKAMNLASPRIGSLALIIWMIAREVPGWRERLYDLRRKINGYLANMGREQIPPFEGDSHPLRTC